MTKRKQNSKNRTGLPIDRRSDFESAAVDSLRKGYLARRGVPQLRAELIASLAFATGEVRR